MEGSALGSRTLKKKSRREPFSTRPRSNTSCGTDRRPWTVSTMIANTAIRKAMAILGSAPVPIQITNRGAMATLGTLFRATIKG
ncbi:hypothetical protein D3C71_1963940 [compost metagenome]